MSLSNLRIVLVRPKGAANVGAAARAMKNMGVHRLLLVQPRAVKEFWAKAMAVHAADVLEATVEVASLAEAVAGCGLVVGTTCRDGSYRAAAEPPRQLAPRIVAAAAQNDVALVFGPEDHGLSNEELKACHQLIRIPTGTEYSSLNLAQAVLVCCYEVFIAAQAPVAVPEAVPELADAARVEFMFERLKTAFLRIGYLHASNPDHILFTYRRLLGRSQLAERDVRILLALARQIEWYADGGWKQMTGRGATQPTGDADADDEAMV